MPPFPTALDPVTLLDDNTPPVALPYDAIDPFTTISGRALNRADLLPNLIDLGDIVWSLSHLCRFGGHVAFFYSVLQHSETAADAYRALEPSPDPLIELTLLGHDFSEALLGDVPSPVKLQLPDYAVLEHAVDRILAQRFGFPDPWPSIVKHIDRRMLATEGPVLQPRSAPAKWRRYGEVLPVAIREESPTQVRRRFLDRFQSLQHRLDIA